MTAGPSIVGIGGTLRPGSTSELALRGCLRAASALGARTRCFAGDALDLPLYTGRAPARAAEMIEAVRGCDGLVIATPSYHGSVSGAVKNALDYLEELRIDARPYLDGRAVGVVVCAHGVQSIGTTITHVRAIVHSLRGWPTPMAAGIAAAGTPFDAQGRCTDAQAAEQLELVARQVWEFAVARAALAATRPR